MKLWHVIALLWVIAIGLAAYTGPAFVSDIYDLASAPAVPGKGAKL